MSVEAAPARSPRARAAGARCPLCGGEARASLTARDLNRAASDERFHYARCGSCATWFLIDPPTDLARFYPPGYFELPSADRLDALAVRERASVERLLAHVAPGRLVEIGSGEGVFARAAHNAGFAVTAIEMDERACEHLRSAAGVEAINSSAPEDALPRLARSDAIVLRHVIEHLRRPWALLEAAAANLREGGVLLIETPNPASLQFALLRRRWAHLDAPRHLHLIPLDALAQRCAQLHLTLASSTTADAAARHWDRFGWEYALRAAPRSEGATAARDLLARVIGRSLAPLERREGRGCAYTAIFVRHAQR